MRAWATRLATVIVLALVTLVAGTAEAGGPKTHPVTFHAGIAGTKLEPRFASDGSEAALAPVPPGGMQGSGHLAATLPVGPDPEAGRKAVILKSRPSAPYDVLLIDTDGDGSLEGDTPIKGTSRGTSHLTWCTFDARLRFDHGTDGAEDWQEYRMALWVKITKKAPTPAKLLYGRQGFRTGQVTVGKQAYDVVLTDASNDGLYGEGDRWTIRPAEEEGPYEAEKARLVGDHAWAGGKAWKLALEGTAGVRGSIQAVEPGMSEAEEARSRDPYWEDRHAPRAEGPLVFTPSLKDGLAKAAQEQAPVLISFEAPQCQVCRAMAQLVFGAKAVVSAAKGLVVVRIDTASPEAEDAMRQFEVGEESPTVILLDPKSEEVTRYTGYKSVVEFVDVIALVHSDLRPADWEPELQRKAKKRHAKRVKEIFDYIDDSKGVGLVTDRISDVGTRKTRAARDALIRFAEKRKSKEYVAAAFHALAKIGGRVAVDFLCGKKALGSGDFLIAQEAADALAEAKDPAAMEPILAVMSNKRTKMDIVRVAAIALAKSGPQNDDVLRALVDFSHDKKDTIRCGAAEALGYLIAPPAVDRLKEILQADVNARVRAAAAHGLGHTLDARVIQFIRETTARDKSHVVKTAGLDAIREIQDNEDRNR